MVIADFARRLVARLVTRVEPNEDGMELVQVAIVLFITAVMGSILLVAVRAFWPGFVQSVLNGLGDLFS